MSANSSCSSKISAQCSARRRNRRFHRGVDDRRGLVVLLGAAAFMVNADSRVVSPLLPLLASEFRASVGAVGLTVTAYALPYGLLQIVYGPLGDRLGKVRVIAGACGLFALGSAACALSPNLPVLVGLRFLTGAAAAAIIPLSIAQLGDSFAYGERQAAIGSFLTGSVLGQLLSTSLGGVFAQWLDWRAIFVLFGVATFAVFVLLARQSSRYPPVAGQDTGWRSYVSVMARPAARQIVLGGAGEGLFLFGAFAYTGAFLRDRYSLAYAVIGLVLAGFAAGGFIYSRCVRRLVALLRERGLLAGGGLLVFAAYIGLAHLPAWPVTVPLLIVLGLGYYMLHNTLQTRATEVVPEARGTAVAVFAFCLFAGQAAGAAAFGWVVDQFGYSQAFTAAALGYLALTAWLTLGGQRSLSVVATST
jgi:predicted MFS family arabinose efflux permease